MSDFDTELGRLCRAARDLEAATPADREAVRAGLRLHHGIVIGASAAAVVTLTTTSVAESASAAGSATAAGGTATGVGSGVGGVAKVWLAKSTLLWVLGGLAGGGVLVAGQHAFERGAPSPRAPARLPERRASMAATSEPQRSHAGAAPAPTVSGSAEVSERIPAVLSESHAPVPSAEIGARTVEPSRVATRFRARTDASASGSVGSGLEVETHGLVEVQRALREGRAASALTLLDAEDRQFRGGALATERRAARVFALSALGRLTEARSLAERFLASNPMSPLAERVRAATGLHAGTGR